MHFILHFITVSLIFSPSAARQVNTTVDDSNPDPITGNTFSYSPLGDWNIGNLCSSCTARLDPAETLYGTWHDATYHEEDGNYCGINLEFTGKHHTFMYEVND